MPKTSWTLALILSLGACTLPTETGSDARAFDPLDPTWARLGAACTPTTPPFPLPAALRDTIGEPGGGFLNIDDQWAEISQQVPGGWGGMFLLHGRPTMYLTDPSRREAARAVLQHLYPRSAEADVLRGRWSFAELYDWYRYINRTAWSSSGMRSSDIDEGANRLRYGVSDQAARERLEQRLRQLGIPCYLVSIELAQPVFAL
jgi:hypothetical protein